jgi:DNA (cytosine-5)-methyltransferase 1
MPEPLTFPTYDTVDLFAGPGGWSVAAQRLGLREIGLEFDKAAHMTRRAAGFHTIRDDVRNWGPANFPNARGLIESPPCPTFSAAGKGSGRKQLDLVLRCISEMHAAHRADSSFVPPEWEDERTGLTLEALRWPLEAIRLGQPYEWLAFEQVPTVLPVWQAMADVLRVEGYSVAVGNLQAEQYGVPQTRKRAVLIARRVRQVERFAMEAHQGAGMLERAGRVEFPSRPDDAPAFTITGANVDASGKQGGGGNLYVRRWTEMTPDVQLPTPTHSKYHTRNKAQLDLGVLPWVSMAQALGWGINRSAVLRSNYGTGGDPEARGERAQCEPAATVNGKVDRNLWVHERPATTIVGSFKPEIVAAPGYRTTVSRQNAEGSVRVSVEEAACLQSFPDGFPWQGSRTKQYQQIGNAIPPLLAEAVLRQVVEVAAAEVAA